MANLFEQIKDYGSIGIIITSALIAAAISYGSTQATASVTFSNHETRITNLETDSKEYDKALSRIEQKVDDLWKDNGHKE